MITKLRAVFSKEWRLLWRDKVGLIFLFILPMCLVLFITLTSSQEPSKPRQLKLLLINEDPDGVVSKAISTGLDKVDNFVITRSAYKNPDTIKNAQKSVAAGDYQGVIIIPPQLSKQINDKVQQQVQPQAPKAANPADIKIYFDPALPKNFQDQIKAALQMLSQVIELQLWQQVIHQLTSKPAPTIDPDKTGIISVKTDYVQTEDAQSAIQPNDVQQNVPAWALFGMFFIITPLSGMIVKERRLGVMDRLALAPVSLHTVIWGKIGAFVCINLLQLALMLAVGVFILPWFDLPTLDVTTRPGAIIAVGLAASLAATGFGMLIGSLVKTPEQATVIGPFIIVILAALGGIFVPVYLLPEGLKNMTHYSPMSWALQAFIDIFVRNASIADILPNLLKLIIFALVTIILASLILGRRRR
jgi:ABC-2 type transport system permease protein